MKVLYKSQASHTPLSPLNWAGFFLLLTVDYILTFKDGVSEVI